MIFGSSYTFWRKWWYLLWMNVSVIKCTDERQFTNTLVGCKYFHKCLIFLGSVARDDVSRAGWLREPVTTIAFLLTFSLIAASGLLGHPPAPQQIQGKQPKQIHIKNMYVILVLIWPRPIFLICWGWICTNVAFGSFKQVCYILSCIFRYQFCDFGFLNNLVKGGSTLRHL